MKAVLFDVYQTLIRSIPIDRATVAGELAALKERYGIPRQADPTSQLQAAIKKAHRSSPFPHPEVDVRQLWSQVFADLRDPVEFAVEYEAIVHPTEAVPGAIRSITRLHEKGILIGIVSNAQSYTHRFLERHLGAAVRHFDPEFCAFSYQHLRAKPDLMLFRCAVDPLLKRGIAAPDILMVGDSPDNDMAPAARLGLAHHLIAPGELSLPGELLE